MTKQGIGGKEIETVSTDSAFRKLDSEEGRGLRSRAGHMRGTSQLKCRTRPGEMTVNASRLTVKERDAIMVQAPWEEA